MTKDETVMRSDQGLESEARPVRPWDRAEPAVSSRRRLLERSRTMVLETGGGGPLLITGEAGAGKTWLAERLAAGLPYGWRSLRIELTSSLDAREFLRLIADALGLSTTGRAGLARLRAQQTLENDDIEGRRWLLIVDEAERASAPVWEEIQLLTGSLGRPGGFAAMLLLGRTELARELAVRRRHAWAARLGGHLHLPPLDLDEARELLGRASPSAQGAALQELEDLHRDALGNPRRLLRLAASRGWSAHTRSVAALGGSGETPSVPSPTARPDIAAGRPIVETQSAPAPALGPDGTSDSPLSNTVAPAPAPATMASRASGPIPTPALLPSRPPLRLEEGLVEVGWDGEIELDDNGPSNAGPNSHVEKSAVAIAGPSSEVVPVEDRYAALQARAERAGNRERPADAVPAAETPQGPAPLGNDPPAATEAPAFARENGHSLAWSAPNVRPEPAHEFAPYGAHFARSHPSQQN